MNETLGSELYRSCLVYLDDIIVWGETLDEVLTRSERIVVLLKEAGLVLSGLKSEFGLTKVKLLGKTITDGKIYPGKDKV